MIQDHKELLGHKEQVVLLDQQGHKAQQDQQVAQVLQAALDHKELWVTLEPQGHRALLDQLEQVVLLVPQDHKELRAQQVLQDHKALLDQQVLQDLQVLQVILDQLGHRALLDQQVLQDLQVLLGQQVLVPQDHKAQQVLLEQVAQQDPGVLQDQ